MKRTIETMAVFLVMISFTASEVFSADSVYIGISCTIPAIPGINTPIIEEEKEMQGEDKDSVKQADEREKSPQTQEKIIPDELSLSQKNRFKQVFFLSEENTPAGLIQTVYIR